VVANFEIGTGLVFFRSFDLVSSGLSYVEITALKMAPVEGRNVCKYTIFLTVLAVLFIGCDEKF